MQYFPTIVISMKTHFMLLQLCFYFTEFDNIELHLCVSTERFAFVDKNNENL